MDWKTNWGLGFACLLLELFCSKDQQFQCNVALNDTVTVSVAITDNYFDKFEPIFLL